jgi:hypothetical protein
MPPSSQLRGVLGLVGIVAAAAAPPLLPPALDTLCGSWQPAGTILAPAGLASLVGSASSGRDVVSVGAVSFPPFVLGSDHLWHSPSGHPEPDQPDAEGTTGYTGRLTIGGVGSLG